MTKSTNTAHNTLNNGETGATDTDANNVQTSPGASQTNKPSLFNLAGTPGQDVAEKATISGSVRQMFAEAADMAKAGADKDKEALEIASNAAGTLFKAVRKGLFNSAEVSALLGDTFGYVPKADGTPGKTPAGRGAEVRKRIQRADAAFSYLNAPTENGFFAGLEPDSSDDDGNTLESVCYNLESGSVSIWTAYDLFSGIVRAHKVKIEAAFNPKTMAAIAQALKGDGAYDTIKADPALIEIYGHIARTLIGWVAPDDLKAIA